MKKQQFELTLIDKNAITVINLLYNRYNVGWAKISGSVRNKFIATNLTPREHEVAKLCVFGYTVKEISAILYVSESTVKQTITRVLNKTGLEEKKDFVYII